MLAYCGLNCSACDAFKATWSGNREELQKVAETWGAESYKDLICLGCSTDSPFVANYAKGCAIRSCAVEKGVSTCAACADYSGCEKISGFLSKAAKAKAMVDLLREKLA